MSIISAQKLLAVLSAHIGANAAVRPDELVRRICKITAVDPMPHEQPGLQRQVREVVVQLRMEGHHICAHPSSGYYMAATAEELDDCCKFLYERAITSLAQVAAMKRVSLPDLRGQLHLPT